MKKVLFTLIAGLIIFVIACSPKTITSASTSEGKTETVTPPATTETNGYVINVLNPDLASPRKEMKGMIDGVNIMINYGSPFAKGRQILNGLIPFGKVWRTGANEATTFEISKDLKVEGKLLPAGKYGFFTLSNEGSCEIIFNSTYDQWGAYDYDSGKDVLRVIVKPSVSELPIESMDFKIINNTIMVVWEKVAIPFEVEPG
ncbi:MAG: hypothetical protein ACI8X3_000186 [Saprospiraceae bacterium]|jgi:hypothetical protein